jgi:hypothetical protein
MTAVTRVLGPKAFTWSYSRLKNFEACPKKHYEVDILKRAKEEESEQLGWGNRVHDALAKRCGDKRVALPPAMTRYEPWCERLVTSPGIILVEQQLALTKEFAPCGYFDANVWFRAKGDVIKINGPVALIVDWKTGKIIEDSVQLALSAACVFAKFPEIKKIRSRFAWLKDNAETDKDFTPEDMPGFWRSIWPRVEALEHAHNTTTYMAKPGGLCRNWCPVASCPHHGSQS